MKEEKIKELQKLIDEVIYSPTKKDAQISVRRLEFMASDLNSEVDGYLSGKLREVISYAKEASGQSKNKDHWISQVERCWYVFENGLKEI